MLHADLQKSIDYWIANTKMDDLYIKNTPIEQLEYRNSSSFDIPEYSSIYRTLNELHDQIYHRYMVMVYEQKSDDLEDLVRRENMMNLLLRPEFIDALCKKFDKKTITLKDIYSLMLDFDPSRHSFFYDNATEHEDYKQIHNSFARLLSSVKQFVTSLNDELWLYYSQELQNHLKTNHAKFEKYFAEKDRYDTSIDIQE